MDSENLELEVGQASALTAEAYLRGAAHDSTYSRLHRTTRFCQADPRWLEVLGSLLERVGSRSWSYREGRNRSLWVLETSWVPSAPAASLRCPAAYARGYFDAEGGVPRELAARFYIQFVQKDREDLSGVRDALSGLGVQCGRLHNPSKRVDPHYWRFFVRAVSHECFLEKIGSWHLRKRAILEARCPPPPASQVFTPAAPSVGLGSRPRVLASTLPEANVRSKTT